MPLELRIENLSKTYPNGVTALRNVSLAIPAGMFGLLGPNGAGKSTLMWILATLQEPDEGTIRLADPAAPSGGIDVVRQKDAVRETLGYLPQDFGVYRNVSAMAGLQPAPVALHVEAQKLEGNAAGREKPVPMNDAIEVAVFAADGKPLYRAPHRIRSGAQTLSVVVSHPPARAILRCADASSRPRAARLRAARAAAAGCAGRRAVRRDRGRVAAA